ncbi:hypothetical protein [Lawsonella sp.]|uniref:hypothetical protein n=1 Tax=Lawsonella sp. TaxID=2041415 RepID=UPI0025C5622C|nr:hypothetical protein [Lawsonella sp.]
MTLRTQRDRLDNYLTQATVLANDLDRMAKDKNTRWMTRKRAEVLSHTVKASCWDTHRLIDIISDTIDKEEQ